MQENKMLPDSELDIMMIIWDAGTPVDSDYIMEHLTDKSWAKTTVLNFLIRLSDRGFLSCRKEGRKNIYTPLIKQEDYVKKESRSFFKKMHHNSLKSLIVSLYDGKEITKEDAAELKALIEEAR